MKNTEISEVLLYMKNMMCNFIINEVMVFSFSESFACISQINSQSVTVSYTWGADMTWLKTVWFTGLNSIR
jgi:hypothetical protein